MNKFKQNIQLINEQIILKNPKEVIPTYQKSKQKSHAELVGGKLEVMLKIFKSFSECSQHLIRCFVRRCYVTVCNQTKRLKCMVTTLLSLGK